MTLRQQLPPQLDLVFDDAVVDHRQATMAIQMRVRVRLRHSSVGGPTGVPERRRSAGQRRDCLADLPYVLFDQQSVMSSSDPPRVVASVLEFSQALQDQLRRLVVSADVTKYPTHAPLP